MNAMKKPQKSRRPSPSRAPVTRLNAKSSRPKRTPTKKSSRTSKIINPAKSLTPTLLTPVILKALHSAGHRKTLHHFDGSDHSILKANEAATIIEHGALALKSLNVKRGDCVGIMMKPSPYWILCEQMIMAIGAISVGIYNNITFRSLEHYIKETQLKIVFTDEVESYEQLTAFQKKIKTIILTEPVYERLHQKKPLAHFNILNMAQFIRSGAALHKKYPTRLTKELQKLTKNQVVAIVYTSGSTGMPKGVMLTHENFIFQITSAQKRYPLTPSHHHALSILPIAHIFERTILYFYLSLQLDVYILTDPSKLIEVIPKVRPTIMTAVPRLLERVHEAMLVKANAKPAPLKLLATAALKRAANREPLAPKTWLDHLYDKLVYRKLRQALGGSLKFMISGGAPLDPVTLRFFFGIGIPVYEGYGLTETAPVISCSTEMCFKPYSVGKILDGIKAKISPQGELLVQTSGLMKGYLKSPSKTRQVIQTDAKKNRWFHTGDKARLQDNFIFIEGRVKEFFKTSTGKYVNPVNIEKMLTQHKLIDNALVVGERHKYISALLFIDPLNIDDHHRELVEEDIREWVNDNNKRLEHWERIAKIKLIWKTLSIENNELTPKMNIKRGELETKFKTVINKMYL